MVDLGVIPLENVRGNPDVDPKKSFVEVLVALIKKGKADENKVKEFFVKNLSFKPFDPKTHKVNLTKEVLEKFPVSLIEKKYVVPFEYSEGVLKVAVLDPTDREIFTQIKFSTNVKTVETYIATLSEIEELKKVVVPLFPAKKLLDEIDLNADVQTEEEQKESSFEELSKEAQDSPVVKAVNAIIAEAINLGASDIHIEPMEKELKIRFRVDGILRTYKSWPAHIKDAIAARIKILANLDISEKRLPQDGRIRFRVNNRKYDLRISTLPTVYGEKIVMRLQDAESYLNVKLENLGFEEDDLKIVREAIYSPWGMVLVTGPTGSGKTTTLYSALMERNTDDVNIMTVEDPVEVSIPGINQVQVKEEIGLTFAAALRAFLRQDPDIILVGEIRDRETAEIAVKAALTGHLVFSTLHTNDAPSTITRLVDIGVDKFLVSTAVHTIIAQRLIRKLCNNCKEPANYTPEVLKTFGFSDEDIQTGQFFVHHPKGCDKCNGTGYKGRTAVHEILKLDENIRKAINEGKTADELKEIAIKTGMRTLYKDGLIKMKKGLTDIAEIERVLMK
ncbi:GspE/PulE family protein [Sulfurihydrogenibium sp. YO3AOP1]|uniref:GspE/PulE family protein n=1 Tax=Sulfurihydrogenibium sp. (strain YO3AOP1) TaxID=436114 RepID=UPI002482B179|nr:GspE/PulE family protein [Sulfurihydrogenibium sp. YO3AOP1]